MKKFTPTDVWFVAFDICQFSDLVNNQGKLRSARIQLNSAISRTSIISEALPDKSIVSQFLGDEIRIAFPGNKYNLEHVKKLATEVFRNIDDDVSAPTIRGAVVRGSLEYHTISELNCSYFEGTTTLDSLNEALVGVEEGHFRTPQNTKELGKRKRIENQDNLNDIDSTAMRRFVLGLGTPEQGRTRDLIKIMTTSLDTLNHDDRKGIIFSIGAQSILVSIPDANMNRTRALITGIQRAIENQPVKSFSVVIAQGELWDVAYDEKWLPHINFEGPPAIIATRVLAKAKPGELVWLPELVPYMNDFQGPINKTVEGKRNETFDVFSMPDHIHKTTEHNAARVVSKSGIVSNSLMTAPSKTAIEQFLKVLGWPHDIAALISTLPIAECYSLCSLFACLHIAGVYAPDNKVFSDMDLPKSKDPIKTLIQSAAHTILTQEFAVWKQFHSVGGEASYICKGICEAYLAASSHSIEEIRNKIRLCINGFESHATAVVFADTVQVLIRDGYIPLVRLCTQNLSSTKSDVVKAISAIKEISNCCDLVVWARYFTAVIGAMEEHQKLIEIALAKCFEGKNINSSMRSHFDTLLSKRNSAIKVSLEFGAALCAMEVLLGLNKREWKREDVLISDTALITSLRESYLILNNLPQRVVNNSNDALFAWINMIKNYESN